MPEIKRQECEVYSRVNGYMRPVANWNDSKRAEWDMRKTYKLNKKAEEIIGEEKTEQKAEAKKDAEDDSRLYLGKMILIAI